MNNQRFFKLTVLAIVVLLSTASAVTWRSSAAQLVHDSVDGMVGPRDPERIAAPAPEAPVPGGPGFQMVNAYQFRPYLPDLTGNYYNDELINPGLADKFYQAALSLPNNITITKVVVYFYDNVPQDLVVALWRFDPSTGNHLEMATVASSDAQDQYRNAADTSIIEPAVDQQSYSYYVEAGMPPAGNTLRLAAVRIDYGNEVLLPFVTKDH
jgi:hypothetical protein